MINNQKLVLDFLDLIETMKKVSKALILDKNDKNYQAVWEKASIILETLETIHSYAVQFEIEEPLTKSRKFIVSAFDSFKRLLENDEMIAQKIEFEFLPILRECYNYLHYFGTVYPDEEKIQRYFENDYRKLHGNNYVDRAEEIGKYKYDVSICVLAYNKLEYTKQCVESLMKYLPKKHSYELIFINHGSNDGTKEYFESKKPDKQLDILINGGGLDAEYKICEGKYYLRISNDVLVTENAIDNMLRLMEEDEKVAYIVPSTPNIVNYQTIPTNYTNLDQLDEFCKGNNIYNPKKHEWRTRLMSPLFMFRSSVMLGSKGLLPDAYLGTADNISFNDDRFSLVVRRAGYKAILMKDAYCHHFGSVTVKNEIQLQDEVKFYHNGRLRFYKGFGIDPWGIGCYYDSKLISELKFDKNIDNCILGINCGQGSNPLKIKEELRIKGNDNIILVNITDMKNYIPDLQGISDEAFYSKALFIDERVNKYAYNFIVWEEFDLKYTDMIKEVYSVLDKQGVMVIKFNTSEQELALIANLSNFRKIENWIITEKNKS